MADPSNIVVLGGGIGGVVAAHRLRRRLPAPHRVVLIDRAEHQYDAPSFLWTLTGDRRPEGIRRPLERLRTHGIQVEQAEVTNIDLDARKVESPRGTMHYDRLLVALGVGLAPSAAPGFEAAHNFYAPNGPDLQLRPPARRWHATKLALERYWLTRWWW